MSYRTGIWLYIGFVLYRDIQNLSDRKEIQSFVEMCDQQSTLIMGLKVAHKLTHRTNSSQK
jgi:hypothetical protein